MHLRCSTSYSFNPSVDMSVIYQVEVETGDVEVDVVVTGTMYLSDGLETLHYCTREIFATAGSDWIHNIYYIYTVSMAILCKTL